MPDPSIDLKAVLSAMKARYLFWCISFYVFWYFEENGSCSSLLSFVFLLLYFVTFLSDYPIG